jgi:hypothetical protein
MHNLCQVGGVILNILPVGPYLNHGFYNYNPVLFRDIAYANNYEFKFCWIGNSSGEYEEFDIFGQVCKETKRDRPLSLRTQYGIVFKRNRYSTIEKFIFKKIKKWGNLNIVVAYVKKYELDFEIPLQGKWVHNIDHGSNNQDVLKYLNQPDTFKDFHS